MFFQPLKVVSDRWQSMRAAGRIASFLEPVLIFGRDTNGQLDLRMETDDFVLAYIYGVVSAFVGKAGAVDQRELGLMAQKVFDLLFPHSGRLITEFCALRMGQKNEGFVRTVECATSATNQALTSQSPIEAPDLLDYILANYRRPPSGEARARAAGNQGG